MHAVLAEVASKQGAVCSRTVGKLSLHSFDSCLSFKNIRCMLECATQLSAKNSVYVGTANTQLIVSVRLLADEPKLTKKRAREDDDDPQLSTARQKLDSKVSAPELDEAERVVARLRNVLGINGERGLVSYALTTKNIQESPSVMISAKFSPGVALDVCALKGALGRCWSDGMLSTDEGSLPVPEESTLALENGVLAMTLLTHVPKPSL